MEEYINILYEIPLKYWIALGIFTLFLIIQLYYYFKYYNRIIRYNKKAENIQYSRKVPPVSIIICAQNEADNLEKFLPAVLEQNYPKYEVIVVNDGSTDQTNTLLEKLDKKYAHLHHTFLPTDAKYTSRKKMCINLGINKAQYDHLLLLDADCEPTNKNWIHSIMQNYTDGTDIVLGYSKVNEEDGFVNKIIRYDSITSAMSYFGYAIQGKTYKGTSRNISYKKKLYYENKAFSSHLNLILGDDNLFIQEVATPTNTKVVFSPQSITVSHRKDTLKSFLYQKELLLKTTKKYKKNILASISFEYITRIFFYLIFTFLLILFLCKQEWILAGITALLFLFRYITQVNIIRKSATLLSEKPLFLLIPILDIAIPLISLYLLTIGQIGSKDDAMWR